MGRKCICLSQLFHSPLSPESIFKIIQNIFTWKILFFFTPNFLKCFYLDFSCGFVFIIALFLHHLPVVQNAQSSLPPKCYVILHVVYQCSVQFWEI